MNAMQILLSNPNPNCYVHRAPKMALSISTPSVGLGRFLRRPPPPSAAPKGLGICLSDLNLKHGRNLCFNRSFLTYAASHEESHVDIEVDAEKSELDKKAEESQEAWKRTLETFKEQAMKMQALSEEAYEVYSKKAMEILMEASKQFTIQAEKASQDLAVIAKEIREEGKEYLTAAAENSPEAVKDIVETFASSSDELKEVSEVRDFYLGIPYGIFLSVGGFLSFMLTGSISAIRFGVILGGALLALSISSLKSWKKGKVSALLLNGQLAIVSILLLRELRLLSQRPSIFTSFMTLTSAIMVVFYLYRFIMDRQRQGPSATGSLEN